MRVYFVNSELEGCYNVRCLFPLQANGWDGDRTTLIPFRTTPENKAKAAVDADVVVFHRPDHPKKLEMARLLKKAGKKIVFDNDDTFKDDGGFRFNKFMDEERLKMGLGKINETIDAFVKEADLITCSTDFLREEYKELNSNVIVLPNYIDPFYFPEPLRNEGDKVRIGITGSVGITSDMSLVEPLVLHYHQDPRVQIVLFSMPPDKENKLMKELYFEEYKFWDSVNVEWQPFTFANEYYEVLNDLKLDMVIVPRADNYFNRCKSNLKFLENSMLEIPTIAQSFPTKDSPYEQKPEDAEYLLLADTNEEWIEQIEKLINDNALRRELGRRAKEYVEQYYNINDHAYKWEEAYKSLFK